MRQPTEVSKNIIIIPVIACIVIVSVYVASRLSTMVKPMTLDEYEQRYPAPKIPQPFTVQ